LIGASHDDVVEEEEKKEEGGGGRRGMMTFYRETWGLFLFSVDSFIHSK
jgi:hypothetical protein